jgi:hydroxymethylbilane synthase
MKRIRIATRKSKLALWQAHHVKSALEKQYPSIVVEIIGMITEGDSNQTTSLSAIGGKANFVKALQTALLNNEADIAVHSIKDMSVYPVNQLVLAAICERANPCDAFISHQGIDIFSLPPKAVIGTASPRRTCLIKSLRPDLTVKLLRGNVDTRLAKLDAGEFDAVVLAAAGLERLGYKDRIRSYFSDEIFIPAIGQGAIGIECREDDAATRECVSFLDHAPTAQCVTAERMVNQVVGGDCYTAIGAHAKIIDHQMQITGMLGSEKSGAFVRVCEIGDSVNAIELGKKVGEDLLRQWL